MTHPAPPVAPGCYRHPDRPTYVSCVRCARPICPDCMRPASVGFQCPDELAEQRRTVRRPRTTFGGQVTEGASVTRALIALNVVVFLVMTASGTGFFDGHPSSLFLRFSLLPDVPGGTHPYAGIANGEYYRLVTAMFLHFGILHIASNMYVLYFVGPTVERAFGRVRYLTVYLLAGVGGSVASFLFGPVLENGAGASGAIFGLFGAYYVVARKLNASTAGILGVIAINLVISVAIPHIDIRAHLGGLVVGTVAAFVIVHAPRLRRTAIQAAGLVAILVVLAVAVTFRASDLRSHPPQLGFTQPTAAAPAHGAPPPG
ncbi:MAG TPA: rhomboid family intramembrane serine protease [Mycobacteriales bacterium]